MTRDDHRKECIEAMCIAMNNLYDDPMCSQPKDEDWIEEATAAFDSLHGIARVDPVEATPEMREVVYQEELKSGMVYGSASILWRLMSAAGDLTNPLEGEAVTRDDHRKECIEAMAQALCDNGSLSFTAADYIDEAAAAFDSLHGIARVIAVGKTADGRVSQNWLTMLVRECDDLTNPMEGKQ